MSKIRKVDFSPDEFIAGTVGFTAVELGVYWFACALIYSTGGAIAQDDARFRGIKCDPRTIRAAIQSLVNKGKIIIQDDGEMMVRRVQDELKRASRRIQEASENGSRGGRPRSKSEQNQSDKKPNPFLDEKLSPSPSPSPSPSIIEAAVAPKAKRASRIDPNWKLSEQGRCYAKDRGLDQTTIDRVAEGFRDHWIASAGKGAVALDWDAKWRTWVNNHLRFTGSQTTAGGQKPQRNNQGPASLTAVRDKIRSDLGLLETGSFDTVRAEGDTRPNGDGAGAWGDGLVIEHDAG